MKKYTIVFLRYFTTFSIGALAYGLIEIFVRGFSHISMGLLGGLTFTLVALLNNARRYGLPATFQIAITTAFITTAELVTGIIINLKMHLYVWDYSDMPLNYKGQICLPFVFLWVLMSVFAMFVEEILRWRFFRLEKPLLPQKFLNRLEKHSI